MTITCVVTSVLTPPPRTNLPAAQLTAKVAVEFFKFTPLVTAVTIVGLTAPNAEAAQAASFPVMAVLVFASSAFVPTASMPGWLQAWAEHQPVTATVDAMRALILGGPTASKVVASVVWSVGILVLFAPLAVRRYRRAA